MTPRRGLRRMANFELFGNTTDGAWSPKAVAQTSMDAVAIHARASRYAMMNGKRILIRSANEQ